jgi:hypothetical protein
MSRCIATIKTPNQGGHPVKRRIIMLALATSLVACASYEPMPKGYTGPTASVRDSGFSEDRTKAQMFAVVAIDGQSIANAFGASAQASQGRGESLTTVFTTRDLPIKPMKVTLRGSHATGMPIHAMASQLAGTFFSVEGVVDFTPETSKRYVVKGELKKEKASVWIEDAETGKAVTAVVSK